MCEWRNSNALMQCLDRFQIHRMQGDYTSKQNRRNSIGLNLVKSLPHTFNFSVSHYRGKAKEIMNKKKYEKYTEQKADMKVLNEYPKHHYIEEYLLNESLFCPNCGSKGVWIEDSPGDYYEGSNHICTHCGTEFSLPSLNNGTPDERVQNIINQLKSGKTTEPKTPRGN